jgi:hypothetical protein
MFINGTLSFSIGAFPLNNMSEVVIEYQQYLSDDANRENNQL